MAFSLVNYEITESILRIYIKSTNALAVVGSSTTLTSFRGELYFNFEYAAFIF